MARILVTGNINLDRVLVLDGRLPASHLRARDEGTRLGGAAPNTAIGLAIAGHDVALASAVGNCARSDELLAQLAGYGIDVSYVTRVAAPMPEPLILIDSAGERTIIHHMPTLGDRCDFASIHEDFDAIYAGRASAGLLPVIARHVGHALIVAQRPPGGSPPLCHVLIASHQDIAGAPGAALLPDIGAGSPAWLVVTRGADGAIAFARDGTVVEEAAAPANVVDTTGAGDVYAAGLLHALINKRDMGEAMRTAAAWAAVQVASPGSIPPDRLKTVM
jgi:sulfofructose kinase